MCTSHLVVESLYTPECWPPSPFLSDFLSLFLLWQAGDSTGPIALPPRCCCQRFLHWVHLLIFQVFAHILPSTWWPVLFAREQLSLLNFGDSALFGYLWISHHHLVPGMFHVVTSSLFQWLLCNSEQPTLCTLVSHLCLHPSPIRTQELWGNLSTVGHVPSLSLCLLSIYSVPDSDLRHRIRMWLICL